MTKPLRNTHQTGAVSLFIVIFTTLLLSIITVSFIRLMIADQQQATASDLSRSAYDSAEAGVEDAKRLLLFNQQCQADGTVSSACSQAASALSVGAGQYQTDCNTLAKWEGDPTRKETVIQQKTGPNGDSLLDQAYTCVKIALNTSDYVDSIENGESILVPLKGVSTFTSVELKWFSKADFADETSNPAVGFPTSGTLPRPGTRWQVNYPALMRAQLIQAGSSFTLDNFNQSAGGGRSNANTLFLYPAAAGATTKSFALDVRYDAGNEPQTVRCKATSVSDADFACSVTLQLPAPITGSTAQRNAFLRLSALYNQTHLSVTLKNGATTVPFAGVQPEVDSTGRANDLFRRISARVRLEGQFTYPEAAVDITGNLCKDFMVTTDADDYDAGACTP